MRQGFTDRRFNSLAISLYFAHEHGALNRGNAKVGHSLFVGLLGEPSFGFLFDEECGQLILYNFEDQAEVLTGQFVIFGHFVPHGSEGTTTSHLKALLQFDLCAEPLFKIFPRADFIAERRAACLDLLQISLKYFVYEALFAFEIVIKLALSGLGSFDDLVRAGRANSLFVKQVSGSPNDPKSRLRAPHKSRFHRLLLFVPAGTNRMQYCAESSRHLRSILYLISERLSSMNDAALQRSPKSRGTARAPVATRLAEDCTNTSHFRRERSVPARKRSRA